MVLQLDDLDGLENLQPEWGLHVEVLRRYSPSIERWRREVEDTMPAALRSRKDASQLVDKFLWTMSGENQAGDPTATHDGGNGYGLMADRVSRTPPGTSPRQQLANAWNLVANNPNKWTDWGEGTSYQGKPFGALGVIAPYDPDPSRIHPLTTDAPAGALRSSISPPNVGEEGMASATTREPGYEPPAGYINQGESITERLRQARTKRISGVAAMTGNILGGVGESPSGFGPGAGAGLGGGGGGGMAPEGEQYDDGRSVFDRGLSAASDIFNETDDFLAKIGLRAPSGPVGPSGLSRPGAATAGPLETFVEGGAFEGIEPLEQVQDVVGEAGRRVGDNRLVQGAIPPLGAYAGVREVAGAAGVNLPSPGAVTEELARAVVPTTPAEIALELVPGVGSVDDAVRLGVRGARRAYGEAAVTAATSRRFAENAPAGLFRHERAGANIAAEAAGLEPYLPPGVRRAQDATAAAWAARDQADPGAAAAAQDIMAQLTRQGRETPPTMGTRTQGARAGAAAQPAGGSARPTDRMLGTTPSDRRYGQQVKDAVLERQGPEQVARIETGLARAGQTWADFGDAQRAFDTETPAWERRPEQATPTQRGAEVVDAQGRVNFDTLREAIRASVGDVRAGRMQATRDELRAASGNARRRGGAATGQQATGDVGGGVARPKRMVGAPPDVVDERTYGQMVEKVIKKAQEGEHGRFWYEISGKYLSDLGQGDVEAAEKLARVTALTSVDTSVTGQAPYILRSWAQAMQGAPVTGMRYGSVAQRVESALRQTDEEWDQYVVGLIKGGDEGGQKVGNFYLDHLDFIDPQRAARLREEAGATMTIDRWMNRAFGYPTDTRTPAQYAFMSDAVNKIADQLGWTPKQVQAAIWVRQVEEGAGKAAADAATNYADSLRRHRANFLAELMPAPGSFRSEAVGMALRNAPDEVVAEYAKQIDNLFRDENQHDILAGLLRIPVDPVHGDPLVTPGLGGAKVGIADPSQAARVDLYVAARGAVLEQKNGVWERPFDGLAAGMHNGFRIELMRPVTQAEADQLQAALPDLVVYRRDGGVRIFREPTQADYAVREQNVKKAGERDPGYEKAKKDVEASNKTLRQRVDAAANELWENSPERPLIESYATDGRRVDVESTISGASEFQRPDVREAVGELRERLDAVDRVFGDEWANAPAAAPGPSAADVRRGGAAQGRAAGSDVAGGFAMRPPGGDDDLDPEVARLLGIEPEGEAAAAGMRAVGDEDVYLPPYGGKKLDQELEAYARVVENMTDAGQLRREMNRLRSQRGSAREEAVRDMAQAKIDVFESIMERRQSGNLRRGGAQQGRMAGGDVGGGRAIPTNQDGEPLIGENPAPPPTIRPGTTLYRGQPKGQEAGLNGVRFWTPDRRGAEWYATERSFGPASQSRIETEIVEKPYRAGKPAGLNELVDAINSTGATAADVARATPFEGDNINDFLYLPQVQRALEQAGFDSYVYWDVLENGEVRTVVEWPVAKTRPKTSWNITNAQGETRQVELDAGPRSSSPEEAQERFRRNTEAQDRLNSQMAGDRRTGRAQQAAEGVRQLREGQVVRLAVRQDAVESLPADSLVGSRGAVQLTDPAGARVLRPGEQPGPDEVLYFHGTGPAGIQGDLQPGMNLTPNEGDAGVFARMATRVDQSGVRRAGAQEGRNFGNDVGGGRAFFGGRTPAAAVPPPDGTQFRLPGEDFEEVMPERLSHWARAGKELRGIAGLPRTLMTSGPWDMSALVRNTAILGARHPGAFGEDIKTTFKAYANENVARAAKEGIESSPLYADAKDKYGLKFWDWGEGLKPEERVPGYESLNDSVIASWVQKAPWIKGSERAMATAQNVMGMRVWEEWAPRILDNPALSDAQKTARLTDLASVINHSRGFSGTDLAGFLTKLGAFFSGQYTVSRPQLVADPLVMLLRGSPEAAQLAGQSLLAWGAGNAALLGLLGLSGAAAGGAWSVNADPRDADFGQLKIGTTRYDTLAGLGPLTKLVARTGAIGSDAVFGTDFARDRDRVGTLLKTYFENKEQPVARAITDFLQYNKLPALTDLPQWFVPMLASGIVETAWNEDGLYKLQALPAALAGSVGVGTSTYASAQDRAQQSAQEHFGRDFDDLSAEERFGAILQTPEREQKQLKQEARKVYERELKDKGYRTHWDEAEKTDFYRKNPELEVAAWALEGRAFTDVDAADRAMVLNVPGVEIKYRGMKRDLNADEDSRKAWEDSKDIFAWYDGVEEGDLMHPDMLQATARRMYKQDFKALNSERQSAVRSNIRETAAIADPEADAWLYWWGRTSKPKSNRSSRLVEGLYREYGFGAQNDKSVGDFTGQVLTGTR